MGGSKNSRKGVRATKTENAPQRGENRPQQTKRRNNRRNRATARRAVAKFSSDPNSFQIDVTHIPAKNAKYATDGCIICGYIQRG